MPKLALYMIAQTQGIKSIEVKESYTFNMKCTACGKQDEGLWSVEFDEYHQIPDSEEMANLLLKCKRCGRIGSMTMMDAVPYVEIGQRQRILTMDCHGCEPVKFYYPNLLYKAIGVGKKGATWDLELWDDFFGIDEETSCEVSITDFWFDIAEL